MLDLLARPVYANCPVCVITVGGGLLMARKLGIDDLLVSIWLSGLNTAVAFWFVSTIKNKTLNRPFIWSILFYFLTLAYLSYTNQLGHLRNTFLGVDKIVLGLTIGLITFFVSIFVDKLIRYKNNKKVLFPYQKVIIPFAFLTAATLVFRLLIK
jgi:hypothetical protein